MNKKEQGISIPTQPPFVKSHADAPLISSQVDMTINDKSQYEMVCLTCGVLQPRNSTEYCREAIHMNKWDKRQKTLRLDQGETDEWEALDGGTYRVTQLKDEALLTAQEGEHTYCRCTKCMIGDPEWSFMNPYNNPKFHIDLQKELEKFMLTNGLEGMNIMDVQRQERANARTQVENPEIVLLATELRIKPELCKKCPCGEKWSQGVTDRELLARKYETDEDDTTTAEGIRNRTIMPIESMNPKLSSKMHWLPTPITKDSLESFNPEIQRNMSRKGTISRHDYWMQENWQTLPWCHKTQPKRIWDFICCDCDECTKDVKQETCTHEFCIDIRKQNAEILEVQKKIDEAKLDIQLAPLIYKSDNPESMYKKGSRWQKHVLRTNIGVPEGHHVEYDSWKGTSFVKDEPKKATKDMKGPVTGYMINIMKDNGMDCPSWFTYGDAYEIVGHIYTKEVAKAKALLESRVNLHEHQKVHTAPFKNSYCKECEAWYFHFEESELGLNTVPEHDEIIFEEQWDNEYAFECKCGLIIPRRYPLMDTRTHSLVDENGKMQFNIQKTAVPWRTTSFNEQGALTYKRFNVAIVGTSHVPDWRKIFFKREVDTCIDIGIEMYNKNHLTIVSGGAEGVDSIVRECCKARGVNFVEIRPEVEQFNDQFGRKGYRTRNQEIAKKCCLLFNLVSPSTHEQGPKCYHCPGEMHWRSGGCMTEQYAKDLGSDTKKVLVP